MSRKRDSETMDLFAVPEPAEALPGAMDYRALATGLVGDMLGKAAAIGKDRHHVAAEMSRLTGKEVSKYMLDAYASEARDDFNIPFYLIPALETVCNAHSFTAWLSQVRGGRLYLGREAQAAELGQLEHQREMLEGKIAELKRRLKS